MSINVKDTGGRNYKPMPQGTHHAVCDMVIDLGSQNTSWDGEAKVVHQVFIRWQVPAFRVKYELDGKEIEGPMAIGKIYTASLSQKANLRKDLEGWRAKTFTADELKEFDLTAIAGANCLLVITHRVKGDNTYANVTAIAAVPHGTTKIGTEGDTVTYSADDTQHYQRLPKWIKEKVDNQLHQGAAAEVPGAPIPPAPPAADQGEFDDDIPF